MKKQSHASWEAQQKRKTHMYQMEVLSKLACHSHICYELGVEPGKVYELMRKFRTEYHDSCKTFSVCPICDHALTGKKRRKATKSVTHFHCNICNKPSTQYYPDGTVRAENRVIHHFETLAEARITIRQTHPELFL